MHEKRGPAQGLRGLPRPPGGCDRLGCPIRPIRPGKPEASLFPVVSGRNSCTPRLRLECVFRRGGTTGACLWGDCATCKCFARGLCKGFVWPIKRPHILGATGMCVGGSSTPVGVSRRRVCVLGAVTPTSQPTWTANPPGIVQCFVVCLIMAWCIRPKQRGWRRCGCVNSICVVLHSVLAHLWLAHLRVASVYTQQPLSPPPPPNIVTAAAALAPHSSGPQLHKRLWSCQSRPEPASTQPWVVASPCTCTAVLLYWVMTCPGDTGTTFAATARNPSTSVPCRPVCVDNLKGHDSRVCCTGVAHICVGKTGQGGVVLLLQRWRACCGAPATNSPLLDFQQPVAGVGWCASEVHKACSLGCAPYCPFLFSSLLLPTSTSSVIRTGWDKVRAWACVLY